MAEGMDVPRPRILFLGGRSFELEEESADLIGCRRLAIVERDRIFVPKSNFEGGYEGIALVIEGFAFGDSWTIRPKRPPRLHIFEEQSMAVTAVRWGRFVGDVVVKKGAWSVGFRLKSRFDGVPGVTCFPSGPVVVSAPPPVATWTENQLGLACAKLGPRQGSSPRLVLNSIGPNLKQSGKFYDPPVIRVFDLLHRSVGPSLPEAHSSIGTKQNLSAMELRLLPHCASPFIHAKHLDFKPGLRVDNVGSRSPPAPNQLLDLQIEACSEKGKRLDHSVNPDFGADCGVIDGRWLDEDKNLSLVIYPLAMETESVAVTRVETTSETMRNGFKGQDLLGLGEVLSQIQEVSCLLGVSFVGHEDEAMKLFSAIEASWRGSAHLGKQLQVVGHKGNAVAE
ncbi:hypothetical protein LOK49_LG03G02009 [Camellia lanceoleosa]|uniref:Uncharacterized protein n=1 Tax=Camellia lanceoleosa TaxID=1840588 RepID=A0ACC0I9D5_9ERIC|nr:hypothetical protein LOK49_LG03G02009 [Camellia lanceoleosa]